MKFLPILCRRNERPGPTWGGDERSPVRDFLRAAATVALIFGSLILAAWVDLGGRG